MLNSDADPEDQVMNVAQKTLASWSVIVAMAMKKSAVFTVRVHTHIYWPKLSRKKIFHFNFLIQFFICLYLEAKLIIVFHGIILRMDTVIAF